MFLYHQANEHYSWMDEYASAQRSALMKGRTPEFYGDAFDSSLDAALPGLIENDWEFWQWLCYRIRWDWDASGLREAVAGHYPKEALFDYFEFSGGRSFSNFVLLESAPS